MDERRTVCLNIEMVTTNGMWTDDSAEKVFLQYAFPAFICQIIAVLFFSRLFAFLLKPLGQPLVVSEILAGIVLGPSVLGHLVEWVGDKLFSTRWVMTLETGAHLGLIYFLFIVGVGLDVDTLKHTVKKSAAIAFASIAVPFIITFGASSVIIHHLFKDAPPSSPQVHRPPQRHLAAASSLLPAPPPPPSSELIIMKEATEPFHFLISLVLATTSVPVLARIATEMRLLNTELGRLALSSAVINEMLSWVIIAVATAVLHPKGIDGLAMWVAVSCMAFVLFCVYVVRPALDWMVRHTPEGEQISNSCKASILVGVVGAAAVAEVIGVHAEFGAFVFGLVVPAGPLSMQLPEMIGDSAISLLMPLYFACAGLKSDIYRVNDVVAAGTLFIVFIVSCAAKLGSTLVVAQYFAVPFREAISLGFLLNTSGLIVITGANRMSLDTPAYTVVVLAALVMTMAITPALRRWYKPTKPNVGAYRRRNVQLVRPGAELRLLTCVHTGKNVPSLLALLDAANPTKRSPIFVFAVHLIELLGRASAMLIVHQSNSRNSAGTTGRHRGGGAESEHIISALESYEQRAGGVSVQALTAITPYSSMHEDVCAVAEEKRAVLIILPFQKHPVVDVTGAGQSVPANDAVREFNRSVLANAPCSVAILVDKGLGRAGRYGGPGGSSAAVIFLGGPDDREALAFASRLAERPGTSLLLLRLVPGQKVVEATAERERLSDSDSPAVRQEESSSILQEAAYDEKAEKLWDDKCCADFRAKFAGDEMVKFAEKVVNNCEETVAVIRSLGGEHELCMVGRTPGGGGATAASVTAGLEEWCEYPELGALGDIVASRDFGAAASVLVFQQYVVEDTEKHYGGAGGVASPGQSPKKHKRGLSTNWVPPPAGGDAMLRHF